MISAGVFATSLSVDSSVGKNGAYNNRIAFYGATKGSPRYNMLVVRITADGRLENSMPCVMCVYMMQLYGIYRVYYSDDKGEICCQQISDMIKKDAWMSKGLFQMKVMWGTSIRTTRLPLMKKHKTLLLTQEITGYLTGLKAGDLPHSRSPDGSTKRSPLVSGSPNCKLRR
jgi:hypothetical protein